MTKNNIEYQGIKKSYIGVYNKNKPAGQSINPDWNCSGYKASRQTYICRIPHEA